jgi:pyrimidine operon attenuation protein/uracil phosphoribosyltransferase
MKWSNDVIEGFLRQMAESTDKLLANDSHETHLVGIQTGGVWVAKALNRYLTNTLPLSTLATSFYRDDFQQRGMKTQIQPSELPASIDDCTILLVDDVLMSGRTIRAALNELFDYGRPARVLLAVLFDIGQRELPVQADICGKHLAISPPERVELRGPSPLTAHLIQIGDSHS